MFIPSKNCTKPFGVTWKITTIYPYRWILTSYAGKDLLEKVQRLEAVAEAAKACLPLVRGFLVATDAKEGTEWSQAYLRLDQALAALEGGSHEQTD